MKEKKTLGVCMIVKDESKYLGECLSRIQEIADEIRIADTGSSDETITIAKEHGAVVETYPWDDDFSHARNFIMETMTTDWILMLDADEYLTTDSIPELRNIVETGTEAAYRFIVRSYRDKEAITDYSIHVPVRLIQNNRGAYYVGSVHEQLVIDGQMGEFPVVNVILNHYGYTKKTVSLKNKHERNRVLLRKEQSRTYSAFYSFLMGNEYQAEKDYDSAKQHYMIALHLLSEFERKQYFVILLYYQMIECLLALCDYDGAQAVVTRARREYPASNEYFYLSGRVLQEKGLDDEAINVYLQCMKREEAPWNLQLNHGIQSFYPLYRLGQIYEKKENYSIAKKYYYLAYESCKEEKTFLYRAIACQNKETSS